jgi:hypothetical protein
MHVIQVYKILFLFCLSLSIQYVDAQTKNLNLPERFMQNDSNFLEKYEIEHLENFQLSRLTIDTSFDSFYRVINRNQIIEVWKNNSNYYGNVINFTRIHSEKEIVKLPENEIIFSKIFLHSDTAELTFKSLQAIDSLPDLENLSNWYVGFDGETYVFESATQKTYQFKTYWSPSSQIDDASFKKEINNVINYIYKDLYLYRYSEEFLQNLPNGTYTDGFMFTVVHHSKKTKKKSP